jgi:hypothetical protein
VIVDQVMDLAALVGGTARIPAQLQLPELEAESVIEQQPPGKRLSDPQNQLHVFGRLK